MPDTQVERISQLDIGDGKLYEFAGANNGMVFNNVTDALAAIQAGTVANGDVFYIKNDGTSGYPVFIGTSAQIAAADNAGKIPAGMLIYCTDDSVNDITALQVSYGNTTVKAKLDDIGDTDISDIGDGTVTGAISQLNSDLISKAPTSAKFHIGSTSNVSISSANTYINLPLSIAADRGLDYTTEATADGGTKFILPKGTYVVSANVHGYVPSGGKIEVKIQSSLDSNSSNMLYNPQTSPDQFYMSVAKVLYHSAGTGWIALMIKCSSTSSYVYGSNIADDTNLSIVKIN